jgi:predicted dehydrogenase
MTNKKIRFGIISTAKIGIEKVIPAMQLSKHCEVNAISSRNLSTAERAAEKLGIARSYCTYEELLEDPDIDAVYIPLPNHLHLPWILKSMRAGKHVLCEKPITLNAEEAQQIHEESKKYTDIKFMEAFMYRFHPRWKRTYQLLRNGEIGTLKCIHSFFSYYNDDPDNIRNIADMGGGGLMDIGCYSISLSRFLFGEEPVTVKGIMENDPTFNVDRLTSGLLQFSSGTSIFTCSTQSYKDQFIIAYGTDGKIEMDWPFNPETDSITTLHITDNNGQRIEEFPPSNHFTIQADLFAESILQDKKVPTPFDDAIANMSVIDRLRSDAGQVNSM